MSNTPTRWRQVLGSALLANTIATGLALGSATDANAQTRSEFFHACVKNRGAGSDFECCLAAYGTPNSDPKTGGYRACTIQDAGAPMRSSVQSGPAPASPPPTGAQQVPGHDSLG